MSNVLLKELVNNFQKTGVECTSNAYFFEAFLIYINSLDSNAFSFDGDGAYFGKQITVCEKYPFKCDTDLDFEVAYSIDEIVVYSANHGGYYVIPYCTLLSCNEKFEEYSKRFFNILKNKFGLI